MPATHIKKDSKLSLSVNPSSAVPRTKRRHELATAFANITLLLINCHTPGIETIPLRVFGIIVFFRFFAVHCHPF